MGEEFVEVEPIVEIAEEKKAAEEHAAAKNHVGAKAWIFCAAKAHEGWPVGKLLTSAEYDQAVFAATGAALR